MRFVKPILLGLGCLAVVMGVVWVGQGTGIFPYPASSTMIDQLPWAYRGIVLAIAGLVLVGVSKKF